MERMKGTKLTQTAGFGAHTSLKKSSRASPRLSPALKF